MKKFMVLGQNEDGTCFCRFLDTADEVYRYALVLFWKYGVEIELYERFENEYKGQYAMLCSATQYMAGWRREILEKKREYLKTKKEAST